jgi:isocitrate/isopropylmalate dehydrogenase
MKPAFDITGKGYHDLLAGFWTAAMMLSRPSRQISGRDTDDGGD